MRKLFVLMAAVAFVVAFTLPAAAGNVSFSGSAEMNVWMDSDSKEYSGTGYDDDDLFFDQDSNSNFSASFQNEAVGGKVEMRFGGGDGTVRHWYGTWKMGVGTLVVGQTGVPTDVCADTPKRGGGTTYGSCDASRQPGIQFWAGGLKLALLKPYVHDDIIGRSDTDTSLPAIEVSYDFTAGPVGVTLFAGQNTYDEVNATDQSYSVDSNTFGGLVTFAAGPATVKATVWSSTNPHEGYHGHGEFDAYWDGTSIKDASATGYSLTGGFKASDTLSIVAGYGAVQSEVDRPGTWEDERNMIFVNMPITVAKGFTITPEIGVKDDVERTENGVKTKEGDTSWFGAEFVIKF